MTAYWTEIRIFISVTIRDNSRKSKSWTFNAIFRYNLTFLFVCTRVHCTHSPIHSCHLLSCFCSRALNFREHKTAFESLFSLSLFASLTILLPFVFVYFGDTVFFCNCVRSVPHFWGYTTAHKFVVWLLLLFIHRIPVHFFLFLLEPKPSH